MIHRYWQGPGTPPAEPWLAKVLAGLNPREELRDWTDETLPQEALALIDDTLVHPSDIPRHRANVVRWWALSTFGGVWVDHDIVPLTPFAEGPWTASLFGHASSCAVALPAGHGLTTEMLNKIAGARSGRCVDVSGDGLYAKVVRHFPDVRMRSLPFDAAGRRISYETWAVHLWATSSARQIGVRA